MAMIGDGINDGSTQLANVGIAMGAGSEIALEGATSCWCETTSPMPWQPRTRASDHGGFAPTSRAFVYNIIGLPPRGSCFRGRGGSFRPSLPLRCPCPR